MSSIHNSITKKKIVSLEYRVTTYNIQVDTKKYFIIMIIISCIPVIFIFIALSIYLLYNAYSY